MKGMRTGTFRTRGISFALLLFFISACGSSSDGSLTTVQPDSEVASVSASQQTSVGSDRVSSLFVGSSEEVTVQDTALALAQFYLPNATLEQLTEAASRLLVVSSAFISANEVDAELLSDVGATVAPEELTLQDVSALLTAQQLDSYTRQDLTDVSIRLLDEDNSIALRDSSRTNLPGLEQLDAIEIFPESDASGDLTNFNEAFPLTNEELTLEENAFIVGETLSDGNDSDIYSFSVDNTSLVSIELSELTDDADIRIIEDSLNNQELDEGEVVYISSIDRSVEERFDIFLEPGDYFLEVYPGDLFSSSDTTGYQIALSAIPSSNPTERDGVLTPGDSPILARNLDILDQRFVFDAYVGVPGDNEDYYRFELDEKRDVSISLSGLLDDADLFLYKDSNLNQDTNNSDNDSGEGVFASRLDRRVNEDVDITLEPGTYYALVSHPGSLSSNAGTSYNLILESKSSEFLPFEDPGELVDSVITNPYKIESQPFGEQIFTGFVGTPDDEQDFYQFELEETAEVSIRLQNLQDDADLFIFKDENRNNVFDDREDVFNRRNDRSVSEIVENFIFEPGRYFIDIRYPGSITTNFGTDYTLEVEFDEAQNSPFQDRVPGVEVNTALNLGELRNEERTIEAFVGTPNDNSDFYRFNVTSESVLDVSLINLRDDADIELIRGNSVISQSNNTRDREEFIEAERLQPDEYFLRVFYRDDRSSIIAGTDYDLIISVTSIPQ